MGTVDVLGPYQPKLKVFISKIINQLSMAVFKKRISYRHSTFVSKGYADYFNKQLQGKNYDYIIAPAASAEIAFIKTGIPVIYITDGTFAGCLNYHKSLSNLTEKSIKEGNQVEQQAIERSSKVIASSAWCANSLIEDYKANADKVVTIPYGANFEILPARLTLEFEAPKEWKLLFVGVYWENKGGDIVFNAFKALSDKGYNVSLTVLGCIPPEGVSHPKLTVIPFINKNDSDGQKKMFDIYKAHHILVLPTRFDCTPIVINEASAFGMPCIVSKTGGIEGHLKEGMNGFLINYNDKGPDYAQKIESLVLDPAKYIALRKSTRQLYDELLNWDHWIKALAKML